MYLVLLLKEEGFELGECGVEVFARAVVARVLHKHHDVALAIVPHHHHPVCMYVLGAGVCVGVCVWGVRGRVSVNVYVCVYDFSHLYMCVCVRVCVCVCACTATLQNGFAVPSRLESGVRARRASCTLRRQAPPRACARRRQRSLQQCCRQQSGRSGSPPNNILNILTSHYSVA